MSKYIVVCGDKELPVAADDFQIHPDGTLTFRRFVNGQQLAAFAPSHWDYVVDETLTDAPR